MLRAAGGQKGLHLNPASLTQCQGSFASPNCLALSSPSFPSCHPTRHHSLQRQFHPSALSACHQHVRQLQGNLSLRDDSQPSSQRCLHTAPTATPSVQPPLWACSVPPLPRALSTKARQPVPCPQGAPSLARHKRHEHRHQNKTQVWGRALVRDREAERGAWGGRADLFPPVVCCGGKAS